MADAFVPPTQEQVLATVVFTDVVSYSAKMHDDEAGTLELARRDFEAITAIAVRHKGRVLKNTGDGLLIFFTAAVSAVQAALEIQDCSARSALGLQHRIGIHLGDVFLSGDDVVGDGVNIAARVLGKAPAGGICISQTVYDVVKNRISLKATYLGPQELKNIRDAVPIYQIITNALQGLPTSGPGANAVGSSAVKMGVNRWLKIALVALPALAIIGWLGWRAVERRSTVNAPSSQREAPSAPVDRADSGTFAAGQEQPEASWLPPNSLTPAATPTDWIIWTNPNGKARLFWDYSQSPPALCLEGLTDETQANANLLFTTVSNLPFLTTCDAMAEGKPAQVAVVFYEARGGVIMKWDPLFDPSLSMSPQAAWRRFARTTIAPLQARHVRLCITTSGLGKVWIRNVAVSIVRQRTLGGMGLTAAGRPTLGAGRVVSLMPPIGSPLPPGWKWDLNTIVSVPGASDLNQLPLAQVKLPEEYNFVVDFSVSSAYPELMQFLTHDDRSFYWTTSGLGGRVVGFGAINGRAPWHQGNTTGYWKPQTIVPGRQCISDVRVRRDSVAAFLDGVLISELATDYSNLGLVRAGWTTFPARTLGISAYKTDVRINAMRLVDMSDEPASRATEK